MVSSPVQNLSDFLKNKPPLVIFILCLVALAVSTFYFAFEIEKDGPTVDSDKKHDWISMLKHFNKLENCINYSTWTKKDNIKKNEEQLKNELIVFTKVTFEDVNSLRPFSKINGALSLQDWFSTTCQDQEKLPKTVEIFFDVPPAVKTTNGSLDVCVTIKGPAELLPVLKEPGCKPEPAPALSQGGKNSEDLHGLISSTLPRLAGSKFCTDGKQTKLRFDVNQPDVKNYLSDNVRTEIYIHLMWCSYFLVFLIFCSLLYAICKKSAFLERKEQSERLL